MLPDVVADVGEGLYRVQVRSVCDRREHGLRWVEVAQFDAAEDAEIWIDHHLVRFYHLGFERAPKPGQPPPKPERRDVRIRLVEGPTWRDDDEERAVNRPALVSPLEGTARTDPVPAPGVVGQPDREDDARPAAMPVAVVGEVDPVGSLASAPEDSLKKPPPEEQNLLMDPGAGGPQPGGKPGPSVSGAPGRSGPQGRAPSGARFDSVPLSLLLPDSPADVADRDLVLGELLVLHRWLGAPADAAEVVDLARSRALGTLRQAKAGALTSADARPARLLWDAHRRGELGALAELVVRGQAGAEALRLSWWRQHVAPGDDGRLIARVIACANGALHPLACEREGLCLSGQAVRRQVKAAEAESLEAAERALDAEGEDARRLRQQAVLARRHLQRLRKSLRGLADQVRDLDKRLPLPEVVADAWLVREGAPATLGASVEIIAEQALHWLWTGCEPARWLSRCGYGPAPQQERETHEVRQYEARQALTFLGVCVPAGTRIDELQTEDMTPAERALWKASLSSRRSQATDAKDAWEETVGKELTAEQREDYGKRLPLWAEAGEAGEKSREKWMRRAARSLDLPSSPKSPRLVPFRWAGQMRYGEVGRELVGVDRKSSPTPSGPGLPPTLPAAVELVEARIRDAMEAG